MRGPLLRFLLLGLLACGDGGGAPFVAMTFNTGTTEGLNHDEDLADGYTSAEATISDTHYGDGLAFLPAVAQTRAFFAEVRPDVVAFQEIFYSDECATIPEDAHAGFVCETWSPGDPTVALSILPMGYQVACQLEKPDKCVAVKRSFGVFRGCDADLCLDHLDGARVPDCGGGSRVGRGVIERADGTTLTVVSFHGSSGVTEEEQACRVRQLEQVFVDLDGEPAANGERNLILGDFNTDPGRLASGDASAARLLDFVATDPADASRPFRFHSEVGRMAPGSYAGLFDIDHVISDAFEGACEIPGFTGERPPVLDFTYFDHAPVICTLC